MKCQQFSFDHQSNNMEADNVPSPTTIIRRYKARRRILLGGTGQRNWELLTKEDYNLLRKKGAKRPILHKLKQYLRIVDSDNDQEWDVEDEGDDSPLIKRRRIMPTAHRNRLTNRDNVLESK